MSTEVSTAAGGVPAGEQATTQGGASGSDLEGRLEALRKAVRTHEINLELLRRGVIDLDMARTQAERATAPEGRELSPREAADLVHRRSPHLFGAARRGVLGAGLTGSPREEKPDPAEAARGLRARASAGDRAALLAYLRARRGA